MGSTDPRVELESLYKSHRSLPFPPSHKNEEIQGVHDRLVVYDAEVAGLISRILKGDLSAKTSLREAHGLRRRPEALVRRMPEASGLLNRYLEELDRLAEIVRLAREVT